MARYPKDYERVLGDVDAVAVIVSCVDDGHEEQVLHKRRMSGEELARYDKLNSQIHHDESAREMAELALGAAYTETHDL